LLLEERSDDGHCLGRYPTVLEVVDDHCTDGGLYEVLVLEPLPLLRVDRVYYLICFQKRDFPCLDLLQPLQIRTEKINDRKAYFTVAVNSVY